MVTGRISGNISHCLLLMVVVVVFFVCLLLMLLFSFFLIYIYIKEALHRSKIEITV